MPGPIKSDIAIIGAGPAGISAAISLAKKGIPSILIEKTHFPRTKICGDGLSGKVVSNLNRIDPGLARELLKQGIASGSYAARFYSPGLKMMELSFQSGQPGLPSGMVCPRYEFDNFILRKALDHKEIMFLDKCNVSSFTRKNGMVLIEDDGGSVVAECRLVIFAAGYNYKLIRLLDPGYANFKDEGIGVRGYFEQVTGSDEKNAIEIHFLKELLPWYLWIFPFPGGSANVGLALPESVAKKNQVSLKELLFQLISSYPHLSDRFKNARLTGKIEAGRLPCFTGPAKVSGDNYLLLGDAARLIDPFTGEGIGNAMASGRYAAETAETCLVADNFSQSCTKHYQDLVDSRLVPELALGLRMQRLARSSALLNLVIGRASGNEKTRLAISEMLYSQEAKSKLGRPGFYIKILLGL